MASSIDIVPSLGQGLSFLQEGPGASPGYGAIDRRRMLVASGVREGIVHEAAYAVSAAGTGMTVDVDADAGLINVQGDSVALQGIYTVAPHATNMTLDIAAAHRTLPRNDLVVLEALDNLHDASGLNKGRVSVITGTPTSGAALSDGFGVHGTPSLGNNQFPLAVLNVPAGDTVISNSQISDRRLRTAGACSIAATESRTNAAYGLLPTHDVVPNLVVPPNALIAVAYRATWREAVTAAAAAAIFIDSHQVEVAFAGDPVAQESPVRNGASSFWTTLQSTALGLAGGGPGANYSGDDPNGQILGFSVSDPTCGGGACLIKAPAGTHDISVQYKAASGSVTAKNRDLLVWTQTFPS